MLSVNDRSEMDDEPSIVAESDKDAVESTNPDVEDVVPGYTETLNEDVEVLVPSTEAKNSKKRNLRKTSEAGPLSPNKN
ncbi:hypothetical protein LIER_16989 [Lithospermum erythrorhizon]|uniref:Uncharacterized protein n=1 Tax=Lithospermum erythrorhizon TaxID=34254 RepID=A0AAV3QE30_LITER